MDGGVEGRHNKGKAHHEDGEDGQEAGQILHEIPDNDCPRAEEVMEAEKVEDLDAGEEDCHPQQLVPEVEESPVVALVQEKTHAVEEDAHNTEHEDGDLDPAQASLVRRVRDLGDYKASEPGKEHPLEPEGKEIGPNGKDGVDRRDRGEAEEDHQVNVGGEVRHELDDGDFVVSVAQREGKDDPDGRAEEKRKEEEEELVVGPGQGTHPQLG